MHLAVARGFASVCSLEESFDHASLLKRGGVTLASIGAAAMLYRLLLRRPILNWGATDTEANARLPGDELLEEADGVATRAITIDAPASAVWPWIAQMGPSPRGGAYTYDWIENLLGLDMHSTDRVLTDYQHPRVGDILGYACASNASSPSACSRPDPRTATGSGASCSTSTRDRHG
jgi:hypothetical protein